MCQVDLFPPRLATRVRRPICRQACMPIRYRNWRRAGRPWPASLISLHTAGAVPDTIRDGRLSGTTATREASDRRVVAGGDRQLVCAAGRLVLFCSQKIVRNLYVEYGLLLVPLRA